jgi:hypothetical protein
VFHRRNSQWKLLASRKLFPTREGDSPHGWSSPPSIASVIYKAWHELDSDRGRLPEIVQREPVRYLLASLGQAILHSKRSPHDWYSYPGPIGTIHRAGSKLWIHSQKLKVLALTSDGLKRPKRSWEATMLPDHRALISFIIHIAVETARVRSGSEAC